MNARVDAEGRAYREGPQPVPATWPIEECVMPSRVSATTASRRSPPPTRMLRCRPASVSPSSAEIHGRSANGPDPPELDRSGSSAMGAVRATGELRRLIAAVRARSVDLVIILARWNGHSATSVVRRFCRRAGVEVVVVP